MAGRQAAVRDRTVDAHRIAAPTVVSPEIRPVSTVVGVPFTIVP
jgi:hypothetical protein